MVWNQLKQYAVYFFHSSNSGSDNHYNLSNKMPNFDIANTYLYSMTTMILNVPDELEKEHDETARFFAAKLYEAGNITLGKAAAIAGMEKWNFAEILGNYGVDFYGMALRDDLAGMKSEQL